MGKPSFTYEVCPYCGSVQYEDSGEYCKCLEDSCGSIFEFPETKEVYVDCPNPDCEGTGEVTKVKDGIFYYECLTCGAFWRE